MKRRKVLIMLVLAIFIFGVTSVCASDVNDTIDLSEDTYQMDMSSNNEKTVSIETDTEILGIGEQGNYSDLRKDIENGGRLTKRYYLYCDGDGPTIEITTPSIIIDGNGAIIDMGGFNFQTFNVSASDVTIKNLTIKNANYTKDGGAIIWNATDGTISDCTFSNNLALLRGGAIYWEGTNGTINNCNFISNTATKYGAGAIYWVGTDGTINNCNFTNNTGTQKGGAIYWEGTNGTINNCEFMNSTSISGGAIFWDPNAINGILNNSNFINNIGDEGGTIYWFGANGTINKCNFTNNTATNGGAINWQRTFGTINNSNFISNMATNGGAIYWEGTNGTINNCKIINTTSTDDGAIYWFGANGTINTSEFISNTATNGSAIKWAGTNGAIYNCNFTNNNATQNGGAVYFAEDTASRLINCNFTNNSVTGEKSFGGAIYFNGAGNVINSIFTSNKATRNGGAIYVESQSINNNFSSQFYDNYAGQSGGAIFFHNLVQNNTFESIFKDNNAGYGAGMFFSRNTNANRFNSDFINNTAKSCGGAMFFYSTTDKNNFTGTYINNSALGQIDPTNGNGGAITFKNVSTNSIFTCDFINNTARLYGGAVNYRETPHNITFNANFINNNASTGGGVNFFESFENVIFNGEFIGNSAINGGALATGDGIVSDVSFADNCAEKGGAVYFSGTGEMSNCIFTNNTATDDFNGGGAIHINSGNVTNSVFTANKATGGAGLGGAIQINSGNVTDCSFENNFAEFGGAVGSEKTVNINNCNFADNTASVEGGALYMSSGNIENSNFTNNNASNDNSDGGAIYINEDAAIINCNFMGNEANIGSAIFFWTVGDSKYTRSIFNSTFLNNKANMDSITPFTLTINETNIEIAFMGNDNILNAIFSRKNADVNITNVTYWGANGIENTGNSTIVPVMSYMEAGQNVTIAGVVKGIPINGDAVTNAEGKIVLDAGFGDYWLSVSHDDDSYYSSAKTVFTNIALNVNVTSQTTTNKTVNITAKSNIFSEVMPGKLQFIIPNGQNITANYAGNGTWWTLHTFDDYGDYQVNATYDGDLDNVTINNATITISKIPTNINVENSTIDLFVHESIGTGATLTPADAGNLTYTVSNSSVVKVKNDKIIALDEGTAIITVSFAGDDKYATAENKSITVNVVDLSRNVTAENVTKFFSGPEKFIVNVTNSKGKAVPGESVLITINGITYKRTTNENGTASLNINLNSGEYPVIVAVDDIVVNSTVTVKSTIDATDIVKVFRNATQYYARFSDAKGNILANTTVSFNINGLIYNRTTNENGTAKLNINLDAGNYILTAMNPVTGEMKANTIKVISLIESDDLTKYYRNASQFIVRIHSADGGYVDAGEEVTFNINGVFYTRTTNATGHTKLNINLMQGNYTITTYYKNCSQGNNITVLPIINAEDLSMKYMDGSQFKAQLVDGKGKPYSNQTITFNINGILYNRITNSDGTSKLNIRLMAGEYIITSTYNDFNTSNKITIRG